LAHDDQKRRELTDQDNTQDNNQDKGQGQANPRGTAGGTTDATTAAPPAAPPSAPPEGTTTAGALFELEPTPEEKRAAQREAEKKKAEERAQAHKSAAAAKAAPTKYREGTEVRYQRHTLTLPKEMTAKEVLDWLSEDDFPELAFEETELRHDKEKNRLVPVRKAQKKGAVAWAVARGRAWRS